MSFPTAQVLFVLIVSLWISGFWIVRRFGETELIGLHEWRRRLFLSLFVNAAGFYTVAMIFKANYGFITDDVNYFRLGLTYTKSFFEVKSGGEFMFYVVHPFRKYLGFEMASFHVMFATLGFAGSLNFVYVLLMRAEEFLSRDFRVTKIGFWALLCFPNFLAWGRIFGKDSTMLFLASLFNLGVFRIVKGAGSPVFTFAVLIAFPLYIMQIIRPHVAGILGICFLIAWAAKISRAHLTRDIALKALIILYTPVVLAGTAGTVGYMSIRKLVGENKEIDIETIQETFINATVRGSYGGSQTQLASEIDENPEIIFTPSQIAKNTFNLFFAPLPWEMRGFVDFLAVFSNVLLFILLFMFVRKARLFDVYQIYLFCCVIGLALLLSFMTANAGLILRQKTIILPFLFLLLFSTKPESTLENP